jgi:hypothetical protein
LTSSTATLSLGARHHSQQQVTWECTKIVLIILFSISNSQYVAVLFSQESQHFPFLFKLRDSGCQASSRMRDLQARRAPQRPSQVMIWNVFCSHSCAISLHLLLVPVATRLHSSGALASQLLSLSHSIIVVRQKGASRRARSKVKPFCVGLSRAAERLNEKQIP